MENVLLARGWEAVTGVGVEASMVVVEVVGRLHSVPATPKAT